MRLFLYGTLKRNHIRHFAVQSEFFLGEARTVPAYRMFDVGAYPGLIEVQKDGISIQGEVWDVRPATLRILDTIEEVGQGLYERRTIQLMNSSFETVESYFYLLETDGCPDCGDRW